MEPGTTTEHDHPFDRGGLAALSDLQTPEWRKLFERLEKEQAEFQSYDSQFRSPEYKWPRDPLHTWSRVWEYPYAYHHLLSNQQLRVASALPRAVDVGSGVTFFPFSVARAGFHVSCTDTDPVCGQDLPRAARLMPHVPGRVDFRLSENNALPFHDSEVDVVFCISVLEHIPNFENTISEIARILKPNGLFVLTVDLDLRGDAEIGVERHRQLIVELQRHFKLQHPEKTIHPADVLNTCNGPYPWKVPVGFDRFWFLFKQRLKPVLGRKPHLLLPFFLAVHGLSMIKR
jgi:2-polyprenyl-3-methyl-5-hydroxy-6-metoxy-1,4-benzoquinol methylase